MAWLTRLDIAANLTAEKAQAVYPFDESRVYWQLDLDGRDAVEGLAKYYASEDNPGYFGMNIIQQLEKQRDRDMGSVAIYLALDEYGQRRGMTAPNVGYAFIADDCDFRPRLP